MIHVRSLRYKVDELEAVLLDNLVDFACITETWLSPDLPTDIVDISGYACIRRDRSDGRQGGGIACYVRRDLPFVRLSHLEKPGLESLWLLFRSSRMPRWLSHIGVGIIYNPPNADDRALFNHIIACVDEITRLHPYAGIVVA